MHDADYPPAAPLHLRNAHTSLQDADDDLRAYDDGIGDTLGPIPIPLVNEALDLLGHVLIAEMEKWRWGDLRSIDP